MVLALLTSCVVNGATDVTLGAGGPGPNLVQLRADPAFERRFEFDVR